MTTVVVMQPTFLPWLGYFALMASSDVFVFLDDVQFSKQSWQSRNRILDASGAERMLSLGVARKPSKPLIKDAQLAQTGFEVGLVAQVRETYTKAPFGAQAVQIVEDAFERAEGSLATLNIALIQKIAGLAGITPKFLRSSEMGLSDIPRSERLVAMTKALGGDTYLSPVGSLGYLAKDNSFEGSGVDLRFLNFKHPTYPQFGTEFQSHLAVIDAIAHLGPDALGPLIQSGIQTPLTLSQLQDLTNETL